MAVLVYFRQRKLLQAMLFVVITYISCIIFLLVGLFTIQQLNQYKRESIIAYAKQNSTELEKIVDVAIVKNMSEAEICNNSKELGIHLEEILNNEKCNLYIKDEQIFFIVWLFSDTASVYYRADPLQDQDCENPYVINEHWSLCHFDENS